MSTKPILEDQINDLLRRRSAALQELIAPARAAVNQMRDAGMVRGAGPLEEALFRHDAVDQEFKALITAHPEESLRFMLRSMEPPR